MAMASQSKNADNIASGAMTVGNGDEQSRMSSLDEAKQSLISSDRTDTTRSIPRASMGVALRKNI